MSFTEKAIEAHTEAVAAGEEYSRQRAAKDLEQQNLQLKSTVREFFDLDVTPIDGTITIEGLRFVLASRTYSHSLRIEFECEHCHSSIYHDVERHRSWENVGYAMKVIDQNGPSALSEYHINGKCVKTEEAAPPSPRPKSIAERLEELFREVAREEAYYAQ